MLTKIVDGEEIELSEAEEDAVRKEWADNDVILLHSEIEKAKLDKKAELIEAKLGQLLSQEFAEIDAALTKDEIKAIKIK